jgi:four helix bundle protein
MGNISKLHVWQKSIGLVVEIYKITDKFPSSEKFGLVSQMRRAAVSIPSNIAEGYERKTPKDKANFFTQAQSSGGELSTQLLISYKLAYIAKSELKILINKIAEIKKMLTGLRNKILQASS